MTDTNAGGVAAVGSSKASLVDSSLQGSSSNGNTVGVFASNDASVLLNNATISGFAADAQLERGTQLFADAPRAVMLAPTSQGRLLPASRASPEFLAADDLSLQSLQQVRCSTLHVS